MHVGQLFWLSLSPTKLTECYHKLENIWIWKNLMFALSTNLYILRPLRIIKKGYTNWMQMSVTGRRRRSRLYKVYVHMYMFEPCLSVRPSECMPICLSVCMNALICQVWHKGFCIPYSDHINFKSANHYYYFSIPFISVILKIQISDFVTYLATYFNIYFHFEFQSVRIINTKGIKVVSA